MKIKKDELGNIWIDDELCINVPVTIKYISELQGLATVNHSYSPFELLDEIIHDYLCSQKAKNG